MKKALCLILAACMCLSLCACGFLNAEDDIAGAVDAPAAEAPVEVPAN
ncbi:MAG: hypothetical protein IIX84_07030 [Oscillospiraceae bacterium]|nr:hypothetical protein [Oscillospiraceae bacterium]